VYFAHISNSLAPVKKNVHIAHMLDLLDALFAPFARLMVALGVPFPDLAERLKAHYVEAARKTCDGKPTDSRLSVMTGLQRRDVARLRDFHPNEPRLTHLSRLVSLWQTEAAYADKPLPKSGPAPSFEALAWEVRRDVHPRTMLDTLIAAGTVSVDGETVTLVEASYQPLAGSEDQMAYLARNMGDHLQAATTNITSDAPPYFERAVHYAALSPDQVATLEQRYRDGQMALLEQINLQATQMKALPSDAPPVRFRAGGYFYFEDAT
jgi:hypothetical protein